MTESKSSDGRAMTATSTASSPLNNCRSATKNSKVEKTVVGVEQDLINSSKSNSTSDSPPMKNIGAINDGGSSSRSSDNDYTNCDIDDDDFTASILRELLEISKRNAATSRFNTNQIVKPTKPKSKSKFRSRSSLSSSTSSSPHLVHKKKSNGSSKSKNASTSPSKSAIINQETSSGNDTDDTCGASTSHDYDDYDDNDGVSDYDDDSGNKSPGDEEEREILKFLECHLEKSEMNQYWYSPLTIQYLCNAIQEILGTNTEQRIAFLSTPSLYFAYPAELREHCAVFDIDKVWENDPGFVYYDYEQPEAFDESLRNTFDIVIIDPPFITRDVWEKYAVTVNALLKYSPFGEHVQVEGDKDATSDGATVDVDNDNKDQQQEQEQCQKCGYVMCTTVAENRSLMDELFNAKPTVFKPNLPHLVYQYGVYINFIEQCTVLKEKNPEIHED